MELAILAVNVGAVRVIGRLRGEEVLSAIDKRPLGAGRVHVGKLGLEGDAQADLSVHGGEDKAVYAYPADHWPWWESEHGLTCKPGTLGENLALCGSDESEVCIGDRFRWGGVLLEISQPRSPCFKLAIHARQDIPARMTLSARSGWYLRVIEEGEAEVENAVMARVFESRGPSVRETFLAAHRKDATLATLQRIHATPALARSWRDDFAERIAAFSR